MTAGTNHLALRNLPLKLLIRIRHHTRHVEVLVGEVIKIHDARIF